MTAIAESPAGTAEALTQAQLTPAEGLELLGEVHGSGYKDGACLVRRADGQMVQLGPLMFALLECADGQRGVEELAEVMSDKLGRHFEPEHVLRLGEKLADQGLLAGTEHKAPPKRNPLLALRFKYVVTDPKITRRITRPFTSLFRSPVVMAVLVGFLAVCWFVLLHKGIASATAQAFHKPELLLLVFGLAVASAGFHEIGHAAACRYGGGKPGGMGVGLYMVWPAFYTDVTDAYRLPKRDRLRVDLGGLYFNSLVAVVTLAVWLAVRVDALLLLIGLQLLTMVKQLSPMIRADGYHVLSDATGVPDLYAHIGPTMRRLLPGHRREPSALTGRARFLVTAWVLIVVPILLSLAFTAILLFPKIAASAWESGSTIASAIPDQIGDGQVLDLFASVLRLVALTLPVLGTIMMGQSVLRMGGRKAAAWSEGRPGRRAALGLFSAGVACLLLWAWWPSGQYQPIRAGDNGTLLGLGNLVTQPQAAVRPAMQPASAHLSPGKHLAVAMIPRGGASKEHPAFFMIKGGKGEKPVMVVSDQTPDPRASGTPSLKDSSSSSTSTGTPGTVSPAPTATTTTPNSSSTSTTGDPVTVVAFPFQLPDKPREQDSQALAVNTTNGSVKYDVVYSIVTVTDGKPVDSQNTAYAFANCYACTTYAVSFQLVLIVGTSQAIAPINFAGALNGNCPACLTVAIADQIVVTLNAAPSDELLQQLNDELAQLDVIKQLADSGASPEDIANQVLEVQHDIETDLNNSGLLDHPLGTSTTGTSTSTSATTTPTTTETTPSETSTGDQTTTDPSTTTTPTDTSTSATTTDTSTTDTSTTDTTTTDTTTTDTSTSSTSTTETSTSTTTSTSP